MDIFSGGVLQCYSMRDGMDASSSSSSCRSLQEAICTAKTLLDLSHLRTNRQTELDRTASPLAQAGPQPGPPGVNPPVRLCQPSLHLGLGISKAALFARLPCFLQPSKTGRQGVVTPVLHKGNHLVSSMFSYRSRHGDVSSHIFRLACRQSTLAIVSHRIVPQSRGVLTSWPPCHGEISSKVWVYVLLAIVGRFIASKSC